MRRLLCCAVAIVAFGCESKPNISWRETQATPQVPSAPRLQSVIGRPSAVEITWLPNPVADSVTSYTVVGASEEWTEWSTSLPEALSVSTGGCCSMVVSGLDDETTYWFGLRATNEFGDSLDALPRSATPPGWSGTQIVASTGFDIAEGVAVAPNGDVFVVGWTYGDLGSESNLGISDMFVARFSADGALIWTRLFGTGEFDSALDVTVTPSGEVLVVGGTNGSFPANSTSGGSDAVALLLNPADGDPIWVRQFGTGLTDQFTDVVASSDAAYISGTTADDLNGQLNLGGDDAFLMRLNLADGTPEWTRLVGTAASESGRAVAISPDGILFLCGITSGDLDGGGVLGGGDAFVRRFSATGVPGWTDQFGTTAPDYCGDVSASMTSVYVTGETSGALDGQTNNGMSDAFVRRMSSAVGALESTILIGGPGGDGGRTIAISPDAAYVIADGSGPNGSDLLVAKQSPSGSAIWQTIYGSSGNEGVGGGAVSAAGATFVVGITQGNLGGSQGADAAFVVRLSPSGTVSSD